MRRPNPHHVNYLNKLRRQAGGSGVGERGPESVLAGWDGVRQDGGAQVRLGE